MGFNIKTLCDLGDEPETVIEGKDKAELTETGRTTETDDSEKETP